MPLSRLENFLKNTDGNIIYVNPSDLDATDSVENQGNSLTRPFKTIQRALLEAARFSYNIGFNNDRFDRTTIMVYPGTHYIDNRPGLFVANAGDSFLKLDPNRSAALDPEFISTGLSQLSSSSNFDIFSSDNDLYKFNSTEGGIILPRGTSITGVDLRKTKIRPLFVPDPENTLISNTAIFRVTGGCYFFGFTFFDGDQNGVVYKNYRNDKYTPSFSHHKLTAFEYADGVNTLNKVSIASTDSPYTDLQMYYIKVQKAFGDSSGRSIGDYPATTDLEATSPEFRIVGAVNATDIGITSITSIGTLATIDTESTHGLAVDDAVRITGVSSDLYNGSFLVSGITSERRFSYSLSDTPADAAPSLTGSPKVVVEPDNVNGASPYIFNTSLRSTYGMCGMHADGSKATGFKSMVVAQFTGVGLQKDDNAFVLYDESTGTYKQESEITDASKKPLHLNSFAIYKPEYENFHIKASNDAFIQDVSIFAIGYAQHFVSDNGGDQSVTNSNSNFGAKSLIATGFRNRAFSRDDVGYITHIIPPRDIDPVESTINYQALHVGLSTLPVGTATTERLYLWGYDDKDTPPPSVSDGYKIGARNADLLKISISNVEYTAPILMPVPNTVATDTHQDGPSARKQFTVSRTSGLNDISSNALTLTEDHTFINGESVRVNADNGALPDGLVHGSLYYVITDTKDGTLSSDQIKLARNFNDATVGTAVPVTINNQTGGILTVESRVTDKVSGDIGHPIQWDETNAYWYINTSEDPAKNTINGAFIANRAVLSNSSSKTFVTRRVDSRIADDRIYRFRYVIPKEFTNAKEPTPSFVLQESSTVGVGGISEFSTVEDLTEQRNVKIIANATYAANVITFTTELPHGLHVGDDVLVSKIISSDNPTGVGNSSYNDTYAVVSTPTSKTFTVTTARTPGTFGNAISARDANLPTVSRNKYRNTFVAYDIEKIQDHVPSQRDGIYQLTCIDASVSPITSDETFNSQRYLQNSGNIYPTLDRDNYNSDPQQAVSYAIPFRLGDVTVNDERYSSTKETAINFYKDSAVGFGVTNAVSSSSGIATVYTDIEHNLNSVTSLSVTAAGTGYGSGIATVLYNVGLTGIGLTGDGATVNVTVTAGGAIAGVEIVDGGSAYGVGNTMSVNGGNNGVVTVDTINNAFGNIVEVLGVGTETNRYGSAYNGTFRITGITSTNSITYSVTDGANTAVNAGVYTSFNGFTGVAAITGRSVGVNTLNYTSTTSGIVTVTTNTSHGLLAGNKFVIVGSAATIYNGEHVVEERVGLTTFTFNIGAGTTNPDFETNDRVYVLKKTLGSQKSASNINNERIGSRLTPFHAGLTTSIAGSVTGTASTIKFASTTGISTGDYFQINNEIVRVKGNLDSSTGVVDVLRGVLGTRAEAHDNETIIRSIKPIASELRRYSTIRASGHTFEYLGFGHGNYSAALPQRQNRILTKREQLLSQSKQSDGGSVVYTGMNDAGDFYLGNKRISSVTGEEETINAPVQNILGEEISDLSVNFDDVTISNTLKVEGGPSNQNASEFQGPVNFANKITSTSDQGGEFKKVLLKGDLNQARALSYADSVPTTPPDTEGDIYFNALPNTGIGSFVGWVNVGNSASDWRRFGLISENEGEMYITPDKVGINTNGTLRGLPESGVAEATLDVRGGIVADSLRIIGNADFKNGATFDSVTFVDLYVTGIATIGQFNNPSFSGISTFLDDVQMDENLYVVGVSTFVGAVTFEGGTITLGDGDTDNIVLGGEIDSDIIPDDDCTYDLGSLTKRWNEVYACGISSFSNETEASNYTTAALTVTGGIGVGKTSYFQQDIICNASVTANSDARLKDDIETIDNGLDKVLQLRGVSYTKKDSGRREVGVIAQEVEEVIPEVVITNVDGIKSVSYGNMVSVLIEAVKELTEKVKSLESEVRELKGE